MLNQQALVLYFKKHGRFAFFAALIGFGVGFFGDIIAAVTFRPTDYPPLASIFCATALWLGHLESLSALLTTGFKEAVFYGRKRRSVLGLTALLSLVFSLLLMVVSLLALVLESLFFPLLFGTGIITFPAISYIASHFFWPILGLYLGGMVFVFAGSALILRFSRIGFAILYFGACIAMFTFSKLTLLPDHPVTQMLQFVTTGGPLFTRIAIWLLAIFTILALSYRVFLKSELKS